jgi:pimeloyl-ACP methyl ester carboxylesterase
MALHPHHVRVERGSYTLHAVDWRGAGEPALNLLAIHGITANARAFDGIAGALLPETRTIAVDLIGRGDSEAPEGGHGVPGHVGDVLAVLDGLRIGSAAVVGWSLGSLVALHLAAGYPERVARLVLLDPPLVPLSESTQTSLAKGWARLEQTYPDMSAALAAWHASPILPSVTDDAGRAAVDAFVRADLHEQPDGSVRHRPPGDILTWERSQRVVPLAAVIPRVTCPVLILRATDSLYQEGDQLLTAEDADRAARLFANAETRDIPGTNHYTIALGAPATTIEALRTFLA